MRVIFLSVLVAVVIVLSSYLGLFIADVYVTAELLTVMCFYFIAIIAAAQNDTIYKLCVTIFVTVICVLAFVVWANESGVAVHFQSHEKMVAWIKSMHGAAELVFVVFQFLQVLFLPIPGVFSIIAGTMLFGAFKAATLSLLGVLAGYILMFLAGRLFGKRLVQWIVGKNSVEKYLNLIKGKDKVMLTAMFALPFFPDDLLCMIAGLTDMSFRYFLIMAFFTRILALYSTAYFGSGQLIPYHGWGLVVWAILIVSVSILLVFLWRNGEKIQNFVSRKIEQKSKIKNDQ